LIIELLQTKVIELPECKWPKEMENFFFLRNKRWRNLIILIIANITTSLATQSKKCFVLKEIIMKLAKEKRIDLDYDEVVEANHTTIACGHRMMYFQL